MFTDTTLDDSIARELSNQVKESIITRAEAEALSTGAQKLVEGGYLKSYERITSPDNYIPRQKEENILKIETLTRDVANDQKMAK